MRRLTRATGAIAARRGETPLFKDTSRGAVWLANCYLQVGGAPQGVGAVGLLPGEARLLTPEVAVGGGRRIDRTPQFEVPDNRPGPQIEVFLDESLQGRLVDRLGA